MNLRIFEPRYMTMVKKACSSGLGFGICMLNSQGDKHLNQHIYPIGTYVKVIDFDLLTGGFLGITVEGQQCFKIDSIRTEPDLLRTADCHWLDVWQAPQSLMDISPLDSRLQEVFAKYPELQALYQQPKFSDPIWVIYRWLELLPVSAQQKQGFIQLDGYGQAMKFLTQLVE